jgi:hypothetical protein
MTPDLCAARHASAASLRARERWQAALLDAYVDDL